MALGEPASVFLHVMISLAILLFAAKLMAELLHRIKIPIVLYELLAEIIVGPFALEALPLVDGEPLVVLDEAVMQIGEIATVAILFIAGLEITPPRVSQRWCCSIYSWTARGLCAVLCWILCVSRF
jgi:Kef-type K+ transport system membrane component KefB